jgi:hypothetical protein
MPIRSSKCLCTVRPCTTKLKPGCAEACKTVFVIRKYITLLDAASTKFIYEIHNPDCRAAHCDSNGNVRVLPEDPFNHLFPGPCSVHAAVAFPPSPVRSNGQHFCSLPRPRLTFVACVLVHWQEPLECSSVFFQTSPCLRMCCPSTVAATHPHCDAM